MTRTFIGFLSLCFAATALAGVNSWTPVGPDGGNARSVAFHPTIPDLVFAVSNKSIYRSADGGQTWSVALDDNSLNLGRIVVDRVDPTRVLVAGFGSLFRSDDTGQTFSFGPAPGIIGDLAISTDGSVLYAREGSTTRLFRSSDFGETWDERDGTGLLTNALISDFALAPQDPDTLYALYASAGVFQSTDGGDTWTQQSSLSTLGTAKFAVDPADSTRLLLATTNQGLMSSIDSGATWTQELPEEFVLVAYHPLATDGEAFAFSPDGAVVRRPGIGMAWETGQALKLREIGDIDFDPQNIDPFDSTLMLATEQGPLLTTDGAVSFTALTQGIRAANVADIQAATDGADTLYVAYSAGPVGLHLRSGGVWSAANNLVLRENVDDPIDNDARIAVSPDDAGRVFLASGDSVVDSIDAGQSWSTPHPHFGANFRFPNAIEFAPSDAQVIYASTNLAGVRKSVDQGATWQPMNSGLPGLIGPLAIDPTDSDIVYAGTEPAADDPAIFKTTDGGATWLPMDTGFGAQDATSMAIDPLSPGTVYVGGTGDGEGLFVSADAAQSWSRLGLPGGEDPGVSIVVDPIVPSNLIMASDVNSDATRSVDAGATWEALPFNRLGSVVRKVGLDPTNPHIVLAAASNYGLIEFEVSPDIQASIVSAPATLVLEDSGTATVQVTNNGPFAASAITLTIDLPAGTSASAATPAQGSCTISSPTVTCELGALQVDAIVDTDITIIGDSMASSGALTITADAHESDTDESNNSASTTIESVRTADLGVTLAADEATINNGDAVTYTAVVSNQGPNATADAELAFVLDAGLAFVSATPAQGACSESAGTITCQLAAIDDGADVTVTVEATATAQGELSSAATIADANVLDANGADNSATTLITANPLADISVVVSGEPSEAISGSSVQYRLEVTNNGPDDLESAQVSVQISGATLGSVTMAGASCTVSGSTADCTIDSLASGSSETATATLTAGNTGSRISVSAEVSFVGADTSANNNEASATITVIAPPATGGGGGGGGLFGVLELLLLSLVLMLRRRSVNR